MGLKPKRGQVKPTFKYQNTMKSLNNIKQASKELEKQNIQQTWPLINST